MAWERSVVKCSYSITKLKRYYSNNKYFVYFYIFFLSLNIWKLNFKKSYKTVYTVLSKKKKCSENLTLLKTIILINKLHTESETEKIMEV